MSGHLYTILVSMIITKLKRKTYKLQRTVFELHIKAIATRTDLIYIARLSSRAKKCIYVLFHQPKPDCNNMMKNSDDLFAKSEKIEEYGQNIST